MNKSPVCFALDFPTLGESIDFVQKHELSGKVGAVKVGLELFVASGPLAVDVYRNQGFDVVLDLKLHDIPETVGRAVKAGGELGVKYMTVHVQQADALEKAQRAAEEYGIQLLGVTVLTSMNARDLLDLGARLPREDVDYVLLDKQSAEDVGGVALARARFAASCGLTGFVCSPKEVAALKSEIPGGFFLVPGVRPAGADVGDQKRVATPAQAMADGASLIVVGRPIRDAANPSEVAASILREILG